MSPTDLPPPRARVAEARRNRQNLIDVATRVFGSSSQKRVALEEIAKEAGVGIGTLYRHFPTREALVEAVYRDQVDRLRIGAQELLANHPPARALRLWMDLFVDWAATKHGMIDTLRAMISSGRIESDQMRGELAARRSDRLSCLHARWVSRPDPRDSGPAARTGWLGSPVRWQRASESLRRPRTQGEGPRRRDLRPDRGPTKRKAESSGTPSRRPARPRPGACVESLGERLGPSWPALAHHLRRSAGPYALSKTHALQELPADNGEGGIRTPEGPKGPYRFSRPA
jgi:AcrR family transcriptional regulator